MELIRLTWIESANMLNHSDFRILTFCLFKVSILWIRTGTAVRGSVQNFPIVDMHLVDNSNHIPQIPKLRKTIGPKWTLWSGTFACGAWGSAAGGPQRNAKIAGMDRIFAPDES